MPKRFSRGWVLACVIACVNARPAEGGRASVTSAVGERATTDYDFDDSSAEGYVARTNDPSTDEESDVDAVSPTGPRGKYARLPILPEPDAEMLPAHYTGVKPPGVDHMEIIFIDSASLGSSRMNSLVGGAESEGRRGSDGGAAVSGSGASSGAEDQGGERRAVSFERSRKGEEGKESRKGEYAESAGKKMTGQGAERRFEGREDETAGEGGAERRMERRREKDRNAAGYRNVYHKDEYKKDADFYDSDHEGGRFRKHGRYDEKHTAAEGDFRKGAGRSAGFAAADAGESGKFAVGRQAQEAKGRVAGHGRDVHFGKIDEFAKKSAGDAQPIVR